MKKILLTLLLLPLFAMAQPSPPPADEVFSFAAKIAGSNTVQLNWHIKKGYYLYKDRFKFIVLTPKTAQIGKIILPPSIDKIDPIIGHYNAYEKAVSVVVPILDSRLHGNNNNVELQITYQGCAEDGYCYPPVTKKIIANFTMNTIDLPAENNQLPSSNTAVSLFANHNLAFILLSFFGIGLLLSFTPCVLPMIPILSGIIMGHRKHITTGKAFRLSLTYVLSMSATYAIAGSLVGYIGGSLQVIFQQPWIIALFSLVFVTMALSMFGLFNINLPRAFEHKLAGMRHHQHAGKYIGVAIMGCLATLIVSPCVTPALIGVLTYISQTGNALIGALSLFSISLGMGVPLLIIGTGGGKLLPKVGHWMNTVKSIIGVLMLGVAIYMLSRIIPGPIALLLWGILLITSAIYMGTFSKANSSWQKLWQGLGLAILIYGVMLIIGAALGNSNLLQPLTLSELHLKNISNISNTEKSASQFTRIKTLEGFNKQVALARQENKYIMLDFYADWCASCKQMEYYTFSDAQVKAAMKKLIVLQADITKNDAEDKALMQHFNVIAPPTILFFNPDGLEVPEKRIIGEMGPTEFLQKLKAVSSS